MHGALLPMRRGDRSKEKKASFPSQTECGQTLVLCYHVLNCASLQGIIVEVSRMESFAMPSSN